MDINTEEPEEPGFKKKAAEAFKASVAAAKQLGGVVCDLGKMGCSAAREKARELGERVRANRKAQEERRAQEENEKRMRMEEERRREAERLAAGNRPVENGTSVVRRVEAARADTWRGDPEDKCFLLSYGWLYFYWWLGNVIDTAICLWWFVSMTDSYSSSTRNLAWLPIVFWGLALLFNRLAYEGAIAFFEMVKHLRQIRDELRRHNMREEKRGRKEREVEPSGGMQDQIDEPDADGDEDMPNAEVSSAK